MLSEPLAGVEAVGGDDLAQRRQTGEAVHGGGRSGPAAPGHVVGHAQPGDQARRIARPVPAISSAVPWSGDVRTKGRPSVTLTPPAKSTVLIGISAWS